MEKRESICESTSIDSLDSREIFLSSVFAFSARFLDSLKNVAVALVAAAASAAAAALACAAAASKTEGSDVPILRIART